MSRSKQPYSLEKVTLYLREGDWDWLRRMHGEASGVIRNLVVHHVDDLTARADKIISGEK